MKLEDFPLKQRIKFIKALFDAAHGCKQDFESLESGDIEEYEYQPDAHWYEAYGLKHALAIQCEEGACKKLSLFLGCFDDLTKDPECYSDDELLEMLLDAFNVTKDDYEALSY